jgi:hypothetical protein
MKAFPESLKMRDFGTIENISGNVGIGYLFPRGIK